MLNESQLAFEIGMLGAAKARSFLSSLLARMNGSAVVAKPIEAPIHEQNASEDAATDEQAVKEFHAPEPSRLHEKKEKAKNFFFAHPGCLSEDVKRELGVATDEWNKIAAELKVDPQVRMEGTKRWTRWSLLSVS